MTANHQAVVVQGMATPRGRYPHLKRAGDLVFVSGTSARRSDNSIAGASSDAMGTLTVDIRAQTRAVIENIARILGEVGGGLSDLVEVSTFLVNMNDFGGYNDVYAEFCGNGQRTIAVHQLPHPHLLIEINAIVYLPQPRA